MYSVHNKRNYVIAQGFIRTLSNKIYKYMTSKSKNVYIDKFDDIVNKCNSAYQRTVKMMPGDVKLSMYIDFNKAKYKEEHKTFFQMLCS